MQEQAILYGFEGRDYCLYFDSIETRRIRFQKIPLGNFASYTYRNEVVLSMVGYACGALGPPWRPAFLPLHLALLGGSMSDCSNTCAGPGEMRFS